MKYQCSNCKSLVKEGDKTCPKCGEKLTWKGKGKLSKLSITSLFLGIMAFYSIIYGLFIAALWSWVYEWDILPPVKDTIMSLIEISIACVISIAAIVCGIIGLKRIQSGRYSNKGRGMNIAGIVLGSLIILFHLFLIKFIGITGVKDFIYIMIF